MACVKVDACGVLLARISKPERLWMKNQASRHQHLTFNMETPLEIVFTSKDELKRFQAHDNPNINPPPSSHPSKHLKPPPLQT